MESGVEDLQPMRRFTPKREMGIPNGCQNLGVMGVVDHDHAAGGDPGSIRSGRGRHRIRDLRPPRDGGLVNHPDAINFLNQIGVDMVTPLRAMRKDRRSGIDRRQFSYAVHIPERRERPERRKHTAAKRA